MNETDLLRGHVTDEGDQPDLQGNLFPVAAEVGDAQSLHAAVLLYAWDGQRFNDIYEKTD